MANRHGLRMYSVYDPNTNGVSYYPTLKSAELNFRDYCKKIPASNAPLCFEVKEHELKNLTQQLAMEIVEDFVKIETDRGQAYSVTNPDLLFKQTRTWGHFVYVPSTKIFAVAKNTPDGAVPDAEDKVEEVSDEIETGPIPFTEVGEDNSEDEGGHPSIAIDEGHHPLNKSKKIPI